MSDAAVQNVVASSPGLCTSAKEDLVKVFDSKYKRAKSKRTVT